MEIERAATIARLQGGNPISTDVESPAAEADMVVAQEAVAARR
jgi:hypothetical protein